MKFLIIVNPAAGQGRPADFLTDVEDVFEWASHEIVVTTQAGDALAAARDAAESGSVEAVIVVGGDGTVNEAINGLIAGGGGDAAPIPLGIVPLGTQNVLAHELGIPTGHLLAAGDVIERRRTRTIDAGVANSRCFTLMAGFGFDGAVVREVGRPIKELMGPAAYAFATIGALAKYHSTTVRLVIDDEPATTQAYLVVVANASSYAYRQIKLAPFASVDDGWLDVCVFERAPSDRVGFITQAAAVLAGRHLRDPRVRYYRARRVQLDSYPAISGQLDGDLFEHTPVAIRVLPRALSVFVP
ncbi:MAG: diacylglycerol/lipid kinase family protein [Capsulimonadaceae bacterium]